MTPFAALNLAEKMLANGDKYEVAKMILDVEHDALIEGVERMSNALKVPES